MKKTIKMLAILAMSVSLVACGNKEEAEEMSIESTESISSERVFDTSPISKIPQRLDTGLFFCQIFAIFMLYVLYFCGTMITEVMNL